MKHFEGEKESEVNDKHVVAFVVAHFVYLGNDEKEVNVFFLDTRQLISEDITEQ